MMLHSLGRRERTLSLWVQDRLHERAAIEWAARALKRIQGPLSAELVNLFTFLDDQAQKSNQLDAKIKQLWRLIRIAAQDSVTEDNFHATFDLREELRTGKAQPEFGNKLVDHVRPRLRGEEPWKREDADQSDDPIQWVRWTFATRAGSLNRFEGRFSRADLHQLQEPVLLRVIERGTDAMADALRHAGVRRLVCERRRPTEPLRAPRCCTS